MLWRRRILPLPWAPTCRAAQAARGPPPPTAAPPAGSPGPSRSRPRRRAGERMANPGRLRRRFGLRRRRPARRQVGTASLRSGRACARAGWGSTPGPPAWCVCWASTRSSSPTQATAAASPPAPRRCLRRASRGLPAEALATPVRRWREGAPKQARREGSGASGFGSWRRTCPRTTSPRTPASSHGSRPPGGRLPRGAFKGTST
mmetsp:Transcript_70154/g.158654  ORF Transcript_70154/g.158654 Transcript_70154/m.158654 type:complete len:204 (-) Transcript_70154:715-1326(-)